MMPSMRAKYANKQAAKERKTNWIPRGLVVDIGLFVCSKAKQAVLLMSVCRKFHESLTQNMRFWYLMSLECCPNETFAVIKAMKLPIQLSLSDAIELKDRLPVQYPAITELNWY